uniref:Uncharacterized protein n=1 Tax=Xenopus tropicalis TaxID=8364 RepID=A0A1B8XV26_XENTR
MMRQVSQKVSGYNQLRYYKITNLVNPNCNERSPLDAPSELSHSVHSVKPKTGTFVSMLAGMPLIFVSVTFGFYANEVLALETRTMYRQS